MLLDTHALVWALIGPKERLSKPAIEAIENAPSVVISAASLYEITYKALIGKWPEVSDLVVLDLTAKLEEHGVPILPATGPIMHYAGGIDWPHRDPFDRIIAATALSENLPLISADTVMDTLPVEGLRRIW